VAFLIKQSKNILFLKIASIPHCSQEVNFIYHTWVGSIKECLLFFLQSHEESWGENFNHSRIFENISVWIIIFKN
jgi:hypothetical protein